MKYTHFFPFFFTTLQFPQLHFSMKVKQKPLLKLLASVWLKSKKPYKSTSFSLKPSMIPTSTLNYKIRHFSKLLFKSFNLRFLIFLSSFSEITKFLPKFSKNLDWAFHGFEDLFFLKKTKYFSSRVTLNYL